MLEERGEEHGLYLELGKQSLLHALAEAAQLQASGFWNLVHVLIQSSSHTSRLADEVIHRRR
jgi:hypothetical protein